MLLGVWGIAVPGLIMRMIGDADSTPNIKIQKELLQGIPEAAVAAGTQHQQIYIRRTLILSSI